MSFLTPLDISLSVQRSGIVDWPIDHYGAGRTGFLAQIPVISVIDDDESMRVATKRLVRSLGSACHTFACAEEFLESSCLDDTSCVIADVQLPGMSGVDLQELLVARGYRTPVILITAFPDERTRMRALRAGATCFLSKPCDIPALIECLENALSTHRCKG